MSTKTKTKWRLSDLPTPSELTDLVRADILTKEEAREILISLETDEERDKKSLQGEIKFLRELVEKLSNNRKADIIREITVIEKPYIKQPWFQPYYYYATNGLNMYAVNGTTTSGATSATLTSQANTSLANNASNATYSYSGATGAFKDIKTF